MEAMNNRSSPVVEMEDASIVAVGSPDVTLIDNVTWTIAAGEYWVVGGLPGSGKSSLLLTAAGLLRPRRGNHRLFGRDTAFWSEDEAVRERLRVGFVFADEGRLFNQLSVAENLALPVCYHRDLQPADIQDQLEAVLKSTGLMSVAQHRPGQISRALRQRAGLARALMMRPDVLLLDDPLRGLDWRHMRWWLDILAELSAGHGLLEGRRLALAVATGDLRPWREDKAKFATLSDGRWLVLGERAALDTADSNLIRELLVGEMAKD
jgi:ABC-type transporter Mla maintaining outer membrane lipid asymmetry ATPase subunit MlaF